MNVQMKYVGLVWTVMWYQILATLGRNCKWFSHPYVGMTSLLHGKVTTEIDGTWSNTFSWPFVLINSQQMWRIM